MTNYKILTLFIKPLIKRSTKLITDNVVKKNSLKLTKPHFKKGTHIIGGSAILGSVPIIYNIVSNKVSGANESLEDLYSRAFDALYGNIFKTRGHGNSNYKILKKTFTRLCAAYANEHMRKEKANIYLNAWNSTVPLYISGYEGLKRPKKDASFSKLLNYNYDAADNLKNKIDTTKLNKNMDYPVNLYYTDSPFAREAFDTGTSSRAGSHTGYLRNINGSWKLIHNVHGDIRQNNLEDVLGSKNETGITWIGKGYRATSDI